MRDPTIASPVPVAVQEQLCFQTKREKIRGSLRNKFVKDVQENIFENSMQCTFQLYLFILRLHLKDQPDMRSFNADAAELKRLLWSQYSKFYDTYKEKILVILSDQGKNEWLKNKTGYNYT